MGGLKTRPTARSVDAFLASIGDPVRRADCETLVRVFGKVTRSTPTMWGTTIVGFGSVHYRYATGREGDWFVVGFSPRKQNLTLYFMTGLESHADLLAALGRHTIGKSCLYLRRLDDVDMGVLTQMAQRTVTDAAARWPPQAR